MTRDSEALRESLATCALCGYTGMCHLPVSVTSVCLQCGYERVDGITDAHADNCFEADEWRVLPYQYKPSKHLQQHLDSMQGVRRRAFSENVLATIGRDLDESKLPTTQVTPRVMKHVLKRVNLTSYYKHRWALTKHFNPQYELVTIPENTRRQLHVLFQSRFVRLAERFPTQGKRRKNFMSYAVFIERALHHLGHPELARECEPLKGVANQALQVSKCWMRCSRTWVCSSADGAV